MVVNFKKVSLGLHTSKRTYSQVTIKYKRWYKNQAIIWANIHSREHVKSWANILTSLSNCRIFLTSLLIVCHATFIISNIRGYSSMHPKFIHKNNSFQYIYMVQKSPNMFILTHISIIKILTSCYYHLIHTKPLQA